jgi:hypothetical protein
MEILYCERFCRSILLYNKTPPTGSTLLEYVFGPIVSRIFHGIPGRDWDGAKAAAFRGEWIEGKGFSRFAVGGILLRCKPGG